MPTPGEKRALIFVAAVAALGLGARALKDLHDDSRATPVSGDRAGLARQIEAVDSAIAAGGERRRGTVRRAGTPSAAGSTDRQSPRRTRASSKVATDLPLQRTDARASSSRGGPGQRPSPPPPSASPDPRAAYRDRWERLDAERRRVNARVDGTGAEAGESRRRTAAGQSGRSPRRERPPVDLDIATGEEIAALPMIGPALARRIVTDRIERGPFGSIDGLTRVRGVGRALARRLQPYVTFSLASRLEVDPPATAAPRRRRRP